MRYIVFFFPARVRVMVMVRVRGIRVAVRVLSLIFPFFLSRSTV